MYEEGLFKGDVPEHTHDSGDRKYRAAADRDVWRMHIPRQVGQVDAVRAAAQQPSAALPDSAARRGATARRGDRVPAHRRAVGCPAVLHPRPRPPARPPRESPSQVTLASHPRSDQRAQRLTSRFRSAPLPEPEGGEHHNGIGQQSARPLTEWKARRPSDAATTARSVAKGRFASERPRKPAPSSTAATGHWRTAGLTWTRPAPPRRLTPGRQPLPVSPPAASPAPAAGR